MTRSLYFKLNGLLLTFLLVGTISISAPSCKDSFLTYSINVINNKDFNLNIYEKSDSGTFHKIDDVEAHASVREKGFFIDSEYTLEVRKTDGTVIQTRVFNQSHDNDKDWVID